MQNTYDTLIKNGLVVLENEACELDVAISDGKIVALGKALGNAKDIIDATGHIVMPGMIDPHMHISEPGRTEWEGYKTSGRAAAKGGVTTLIEMPLNQLPATVDKASMAAKFDAAKNKLTVDIALFGGLVNYNLDRLHELEEGGVVAYKCFVATCGDKSISNDFRDVNDYEFFKGISQIAKFGSFIAVHAENAQICDGLGEEAIKEGRVTAHDYVASRPVFTEVEAIRRVLYLAKQANCSIHICHVSSPEGVAEVTRARQEGQDATCESCPHYFTITTDEFAKIGTLAKCSPPLRDKDNQERLWEKLLSGEIDFLGSDHSPCVPSMKEGNIMQAWGGIAGLQNCLDMMFDEAVQKRGMSLAHFAKIMATNAADRFGLKHKGRIAIGKDADIAIIKPNTSYILKNEDLEYRHKVSPYVGRTINAKITKTLRRGELIYDMDQGVIESTNGRFILKHEM
ncbi:allantoinase AllB [Thorsellia kenyensis]|uniref:Allantoinase n=1 Tax=Thorsellia kenyensis TaxID=1549888 RepID=A0ABV6C8D1_9GAMM